MTWQAVDKMKSAGKYIEAGQLARVHGFDRSYGCHFGMRSDQQAAIEAFNRGWDEIDSALSGVQPVRSSVVATKLETDMAELAAVYSDLSKALNSAPVPLAGSHYAPRMTFEEFKATRKETDNLFRDTDGGYGDCDEPRAGLIYAKTGSIEKADNGEFVLYLEGESFVSEGGNIEPLERELFDWYIGECCEPDETATAQPVPQANPNDWADLRAAIAEAQTVVPAQPVNRLAESWTEVSHKAFAESLRLALQTLPTDAGRRNFLGHSYKALVGYDPFEDDPSQTVDQIIELYCEVVAESFKPSNF